MTESDSYELVDFGHGRKLERFGDVSLDRPSPSANNSTPALSSGWTASSKFEKANSAQQRNTPGQWSQEIDAWTIPFGSLKLELKLTPFGHNGLFPEHASHWKWMEQKARLQEKKILNLFAYTGATTLLLAQLGANVVHVDSSKSVVAWARNNATLSGLDNKPVRWIVEDALKFVNREAKRGNRYDGFVADPPTYGHGTGNEVWKIESCMEKLLAGLSQIMPEVPALTLLTSHSKSFDANHLEAQLVQHFPQCRAGIESGGMKLTARSGKHLNSGWFARFARAN